MRLPQPNKSCLRLGLVVFIALLSLLGLSFYRCSRFPAGIYFSSGISPVTYICLKGGKIFLSNPDEEREISERFTLIGSYTNSLRAWISLDPKTGETIVLRSSLFGLTMSCTNCPNPSYNAFYPRRGFVWAANLAKRLKH